MLAKLTAATLERQRIAHGGAARSARPARPGARRRRRRRHRRATARCAGRFRRRRSCPPSPTGRASAGDEIASSECLSRELPALELDPQLAAGALALNLPDGQYAIWFRREVLRSVDWGGDPHNKAIAVSEGDEIRLSPRKSFERWREIVHQRSEPWTLSETESAEALRRHLVESLYRRTRGALRVAETLQRSLLPESIPTLENWQLSAHYEPAAGGRRRRRLVRRVRAARRPVDRAAR